MENDQVVNKHKKHQAILEQVIEALLKARAQGASDKPRSIGLMGAFLPAYTGWKWLLFGTSVVLILFISSFTLIGAAASLYLFPNLPLAMVLGGGGIFFLISALLIGGVILIYSNGIRAGAQNSVNSPADAVWGDLRTILAPLSQALREEESKIIDLFFKK